MSKCGIASLSLFKIGRSTKSSRQAEYLTSTFEIHYSIFDIRFLKLRLDWTVTGLNIERRK